MVFRKRGKTMSEIDNKEVHYLKNGIEITKLLKEVYELMYDLENKKQDLEKVLWYLKREIKNGKYR